MSESERGHSNEAEVNPFTGEIEAEVEDTTEDSEDDTLEETQDSPDEEFTEEEPSEEETPKEELTGDARRMVIDTIEREFDRLDAGTLSPEELAEYFKTNKDIAQVADGSKRVKDRYRKFVKKFEAGEYQRIREESKETPTTPETKSNLTEEERFLAMLKKHDEDREKSLVERTLRDQREKELETFATSRGIKDADFSQLEKTAKALYEINDSWSYKDSLAAANRALFKTKSSPVQVPSGSSSTSSYEEKKSQSVDFSRGSALVSGSDWGL